MHVVVKERAVQKNRSVAKSDPLKSKICGREKCFPCNFGGGNCQKIVLAIGLHASPAGGQESQLFMKGKQAEKDLPEGWNT